MSFKLGKIIQIGILSVFTISTSFLLQRDITLSREVITQKQSSLWLFQTSYDKLVKNNLPNPCYARIMEI